MACCILGALLFAQALVIWRWFGRHARQLLVGVLLILGVTLVTAGVVEMDRSRTAISANSESDICFGERISLRSPGRKSPISYQAVQP